MKFIRQIVIILALISAFICLTVFSGTQYTSNTVNLSSTEDKLPIVSIVLSKISEFLPYSNKILTISSSPEVKDAYNQVNTAITPENVKPVLDIASSTAQNINWQDIPKRIEEILNKGLFRFSK